MQFVRPFARASRERIKKTGHYKFVEMNKEVDVRNPKWEQQLQDAVED